MMRTTLLSAGSVVAIVAIVAVVGIAVASAACGDPPPPPPPPDPPAIEAVCTEPTTVACIDQAEQGLSMTPNDPTPGAIDDAKTGDHFHAKIDATAGGGAFDATQGYVYAKFTKDGLVKVEQTDDESFQSMDWDISFRRFVILLNGGSAGPSCVAAARTKAGTTFAGLTSVDDSELTYNEEKFMNADCSETFDGGIGGPQSVLANYYDYTGCLHMSHNVYVVRLADGHHVKLEVTAFYGAGQDTCEQDDTVPTPDTSASMELDWAFLD